MVKVQTNSSGKVYTTSSGTKILLSGDGIGPSISSLSIAPSTSSQTFNSDSVDGYKPVTVAAVTSSIDNNIVASNIKKNITILGVMGSYEGSGGSATIDSLTITPTTSSQTITASGGVDGYSPITVNAVTSSIDSNISAANIKKDVVILGVTGSYEGSGGSGDDEYANYIQIENMIKGTSYVEADEVEAACDDISMFLYGTLHS